MLVPPNLIRTSMSFAATAPWFLISITLQPLGALLVFQSFYWDSVCKPDPSTAAATWDDMASSDLLRP